MRLDKKRVTDLSLLAAVIVVIQMILSSYIYPIFKTTTHQLFAITPYTAVTSTTIGDRVIGFLTGIIPISFGNLTVWLSMFIGAFVMLAAGYWVYEQRWAPWKGSNLSQRLWAIMLYGSAALYAFLLITKLEAVSVLAMPLLIGVTVNYFVIALIVTTLANQKAFNFLRI